MNYVQNSITIKSQRDHSSLSSNILFESVAELQKWIDRFEELNSPDEGRE